MVIEEAGTPELHERISLQPKLKLDEYWEVAKAKTVGDRETASLVYDQMDKGQIDLKDRTETIDFWYSLRRMSEGLIEGDDCSEAVIEAGQGKVNIDKAEVLADFLGGEGYSYDPAEVLRIGRLADKMFEGQGKLASWISMVALEVKVDSMRCRVLPTELSRKEIKPTREKGGSKEKSDLARVALLTAVAIPVFAGAYYVAKEPVKSLFKEGLSSEGVVGEWTKTLDKIIWDSLVTMNLRTSEQHQAHFLEVAAGEREDLEDDMLLVLGALQEEKSVDGYPVVADNYSNLVNIVKLPKDEIDLNHPLIGLIRVFGPDWYMKIHPETGAIWLDSVADDQVIALAGAYKFPEGSIDEAKTWLRNMSEAWNDGSGDINAFAVNLPEGSSEVMIELHKAPEELVDGKTGADWWHEKWFSEPVEVDTGKAPGDQKMMPEKESQAGESDDGAAMNMLRESLKEAGELSEEVEVELRILVDEIKLAVDKGEIPELDGVQDWVEKVVDWGDGLASRLPELPKAEQLKSIVKQETDLGFELIDDPVGEAINGVSAAAMSSVLAIYAYLGVRHVVNWFRKRKEEGYHEYDLPDEVEVRERTIEAEVDFNNKNRTDIEKDHVVVGKLYNPALFEIGGGETTMIEITMPASEVKNRSKLFKEAVRQIRGGVSYDWLKDELTEEKDWEEIYEYENGILVRQSELEALNEAATENALGEIPEELLSKAKLIKGLEKKRKGTILRRGARSVNWQSLVSKGVLSQKESKKGREKSWLRGEVDRHWL